MAACAASLTWKRRRSRAHHNNDNHTKDGRVDENNRVSVHLCNVRVRRSNGKETTRAICPTRGFRPRKYRENKCFFFIKHI